RAERILPSSSTSATAIAVLSASFTRSARYSAGQLGRKSTKMLLGSRRIQDAHDDSSSLTRPTLDGAQSAKTLKALGHVGNAVSSRRRVRNNAPLSVICHHDLD